MIMILLNGNVTKRNITSKHDLADVAEILVLSSVYHVTEDIHLRSSHTAQRALFKSRAATVFDAVSDSIH